MAYPTISIDTLLEFISNGGTIKTGIDIFNEKNDLLLSKDFTVSSIKMLLNLKNHGIFDVPINTEENGEIHDQNGNLMPVNQLTDEKPPVQENSKESELKKRLQHINELKQEAVNLYAKARETINKVFEDIKVTGGEFDQAIVETTVHELFNFINLNDSNALACLSREIFSYDNYLYNHSINVCAITTAVIKKYNDFFNDDSDISLLDIIKIPFVNNCPNSSWMPIGLGHGELYRISVGCFLHDVGKVLIPARILNKKGKLTKDEFELVKTHSFEKGLNILNKNRINNELIEKIVAYHHCSLYKGETKCYPADTHPAKIPPYVKICKIADIYDAMISRRSYKDALNPTIVVSQIFKTYADRDRFLQLLLHAFFKVVGICPPSSIVYLRNGQMAYVIDSEGPVVIPFTDIHGSALFSQPDPIDLGSSELPKKLNIERRRPMVSTVDVYNKLPGYIKELIK